MQFKRKLRLQRNAIGKPFRGILPIASVIGRSDEDMADLLESGFNIQMAGGTTSKNQVAENPLYFPRAVVVTTDQTINQNDMVWWDPVNYTLKPLTTAAQVAVGATGGFCGVAAGANVPGVYPDPPGGVPSEKLPGIVVQMGGTVWLGLQANDVVDFPFQTVTAAGVDAQTVTKGAATSANRVGFVVVPPPVNPRGAPGATPAPESAVPGQIRVWIERKFPTTVLI